MILNKGKYKNIKLGFGFINLNDDKKTLTVYAEDTFTPIGSAKIVKTKPFVVDLDITEDVTLRSDYFTLDLMNYSLQGGAVTDIYALRVNCNLFGYTPNILNEVDFKAPRKTKKKTSVEE